MTEKEKERIVYAAMWMYISEGVTKKSLVQLWWSSEVTCICFQH